MFFSHGKDSFENVISSRAACKFYPCTLIIIYKGAILAT